MEFDNSEITMQQEIISDYFKENNLIVDDIGIIKPDMFTVPVYKTIYELILKMKKDGFQIDDSTFIEHYKDKIPKLFERRLIQELYYASPTTFTHKSRIKILIEQYQRRTIKSIIPTITDEQNIEKLTEKLESTLKAVYSGEIKEQIKIEEKYANYLDFLYGEDKEIGFKSGLNSLDKVLGNFQCGRMITLFARSGVGKSTVAMQIALNMILQGRKVVYASGEMNMNEVISKMAASNLDLPYTKIMNKELYESDKQRIATLTMKLLDNHFYVTNETNIHKLINEIKSYKLQYGLEVLFVDYINKYVNGSSGNTLSEKIGYISNELKNLAQNENICVVLLAQCNRTADKNNGILSDKITESDIQDSARIEQDSDQLIALYRNKKLDDNMTRDFLFKENKLDYSSTNAEKNPECINFIICKNRHGEKKTLAFRWDGKYSRVNNFGK